MPASRNGVRGVASASAAGAGQVNADTTGARSFRRRRTNGVAIPTATAPHASRRRARVLRKAEQHILAAGARPGYSRRAWRSRGCDGSSIGPGMRSSGAGISMPSTVIRRFSVR
jgi:hypothetical protein